MERQLQQKPNSEHVTRQILGTIETSKRATKDLPNRIRWLTEAAYQHGIAVAAINHEQHQRLEAAFVAAAEAIGDELAKAEFDPCVHWLADGQRAANWPMVGFLPFVTELEPFQAREIANRLQTIAERMLKAAKHVDEHRTRILAELYGSEQENADLRRSNTEMEPVTNATLLANAGVAVRS